MNKTDKILLRNAILLQLQAAYPASLTEGVILEGLKISGLKISEKFLAAELEYLRELKFISRHASELSEGVLRSKLNAKGIGYLERSGL